MGMEDLLKCSHEPVMLIKDPASGEYTCSWCFDRRKAKGERRSARIDRRGRKGNRRYKYYLI